MTASKTSWIDELIAQQRSGYSLDQAFYRHPEIFERDLQRVISNHWMMAGHVSQIPKEGDYLLFEVASESIILIRGAGGQVHAHYNVCRHRGSRVLLEPEGRSRRMICRYHGWTYGPDGSLLAAAHMPDDFKPCDHGLKPCHVTVLEGLILVSLTNGSAPELGEVAQTLAPFLQLHGVADARLARRNTYPVTGNWKLAVENYLECYHCKPAHPQYSKVEIKVEKIGDGSPAALRKFEERYQPWQEEAQRLGYWLEDARVVVPLDQHLPRKQFCSAYRAPLREDYLSATEDGQAAAPLMGKFKQYDGGETAIGLGPFTYMLASNDHAVFFQFVPVDAQSSEMIVSWLVHPDAVEHEDYDPQRVTWLWTVTTEQDKTIIDNNAAGVNSSHYEPGPASLLESDVNSFRHWYLASIGPEEQLQRLSGSGTGRFFGF